MSLGPPGVPGPPFPPIPGRSEPPDWWLTVPMRPEHPHAARASKRTVEQRIFMAFRGLLEGLSPRALRTFHRIRQVFEPTADLPHSLRSLALDLVALGPHARADTPV